MMKALRMKRLRRDRGAAATLALCALFGCGNGDGRSGNEAGAAGQGGAGGEGGSGPIINDGGSAGSPFGLDPECITDSALARRQALDLAFLIDTSYSMDFDRKWPQVRDALLAFIGTPTSSEIGFGLEFFPERAQCSVAAYEDPAVPLADLEDAVPGATQALGGQGMFGGTPLVQALQGYAAYLTSWAQEHPDRRTVLVLGTDGIPDETCAGDSFMPPNTLENAAAIAEELASSDPRIQVFVIGVGDELEALDEIAEAGGTGSAVLVSASGDVQGAFLKALEQVRRAAISCDYEIPKLNNVQIAYDHVNVQYTDEDEDPITFFYAESPEECSEDPEQAWHYDDAEDPKRVLLCPETCDRVSESETGRVDLVFGCRRVSVVR